MERMKEIERLIEQLPEKWEEKARESGAYMRPREIKNAKDFMKLVLMYIIHGLTLVEVSAIANIGGIAKISDVGFMLRFTQCGKFFKEILRMMKPGGIAEYEKPTWAERYTIKCADASEVRGGGVASKKFRLHYAINPYKMSSESFKITTQSEGESLVNFEIKAGDLFVCDRAYGTKRSMEYCTAAGGKFINRIRSKAFDVYSSRGNKKNLVSKLKKLKEGELLDWECRYKQEQTGEYKRVRICAMRKPKGVVESADSDDTAFMNNFIVVATSIMKKEASASEILDMYRVRWQVELYFKRLKSLLSFGDIPNKTEQNIETWLNGKLLAAILLESAVSTVDFSPVG